MILYHCIIKICINMISFQRCHIYSYNTILYHNVYGFVSSNYQHTWEIIKLVQSKKTFGLQRGDCQQNSLILIPISESDYLIQIIKILITCRQQFPMDHLNWALLLLTLQRVVLPDNQWWMAIVVWFYLNYETTFFLSSLLFRRGRGGEYDALSLWSNSNIKDSHTTINQILLYVKYS